MTLLQRVKANRLEILDAAKRHKVANPRLFGSVAKGLETPDSDIDILVDALPGTTLFDLGGLQEELQTLLKTRVDVVTAKGLKMSLRQQILSEAVGL